MPPAPVTECSIGSLLTTFTVWPAWTVSVLNCESEIVMTAAAVVAVSVPPDSERVGEEDSDEDGALLGRLDVGREVGDKSDSVGVGVDVGVSLADASVAELSAPHPTRSDTSSSKAPEPTTRPAVVEIRMFIRRRRVPFSSLAEVSRAK